MPISLDEVERIAKLARLELKSDEKQKLQSELSAILDYVTLLKEVESKIVKEHIDPDSVNLMRDDFAEELTLPPELLKLAPNREGDFYKVKSVLEYGPS